MVTFSEETENAFGEVPGETGLYLIAIVMRLPGICGRRRNNMIGST
jgi:hypothetical protein